MFCGTECILSHLMFVTTFCQNGCQLDEEANDSFEKENYKPNSPKKKKKTLKKSRVVGRLTMSKKRKTTSF